MAPPLHYIRTYHQTFIMNHLISGVTLTLWSNPLNKELCPVTALFAWLLVAGS